jgi:hypothetical protein
MRTTEEGAEILETEEKFPGIVFPNTEILILMISSFLLFDTANMLNFLGQTNMIELVIEFGFLTLIVFYFFDRLSSSIKYNWLLDFERRILAEGLNADQIQENFIKEYLGETPTAWLIRVCYSEWKKDYNKIIESFGKLEKEIKDALNLITEICGKCDELESIKEKRDDDRENLEIYDKKELLLKNLLEIYDKKELLLKNLLKANSQISERKNEIKQDYQKLMEKGIRILGGLKRFEFNEHHTEDEESALRMIAKEWAREESVLIKEQEEQDKNFKKFQDSYRTFSRD